METIAFKLQKLWGILRFVYLALRYRAYGYYVITDMRTASYQARQAGLSNNSAVAVFRDVADAFEGSADVLTEAKQILNN